MQHLGLPEDGLVPLVVLFNVGVEVARGEATDEQPVVAGSGIRAQVDVDDLASFRDDWFAYLRQLQPQRG